MVRSGASVDATLTRKELIAEDTYELEFDLGGRTLDFAAGQYCRVALPRLDSPDRRARGSSPSSTRRRTTGAVITTRMGVTGYKCTLCGLQPGAPVRVEKVKGARAARPVTRPLVFVAGGIGIVPFISMLRDLEHRGRSTT